MRSRRRLARSSARYGFVRFQQSSARMALAEGRLDGALAALRTVTCDDFADARAASEYLAVLADTAADDQLRRGAIVALSGLPLRSS